MKREEYEQRKAFAGDKHPSMLRRRLDHDYTGKRIYLITMTTEGRQPLLGTVVGDPEAPAGSANAPRTLLSPLGDAVRREWYAIHNYHPEITIIALQIMPDHLHGILFVESPIPLHLGQIIKFFKNATTRHYRELVLGRGQRETGKQGDTGLQGAAGKQGETGLQGAAGKQGETGLQGAAAPPLHSQPAAQAAIIPPASPAAPSALASPVGIPPAAPVASPAAPVGIPPTSPSAPAAPSARVPVGSAAAVPQPLPVPPRPSRSQVLWTLGYNDHVLSNEGELARWKHYLQDNPRRLLLKRQRPEFLRPRFDVPCAGYVFQALGNLDLLQATRRLQVRVSRRCSPIQIQEEVERHLAAARSGAVLVSPSISPGEKAVMRAAFDAHLPLIVLVENGFTPLTKPKGEQFEACSEGRLLLLAPWPHYNEKRKITASQCQALNLMATAICR